MTIAYVRTCVQSVFSSCCHYLFSIPLSSYLSQPRAHMLTYCIVWLPWAYRFATFSSHSASLLFLTLILSLLLDTFVHPSDRQLSTVYFIDHSQLSAQFFFFLSISRFTSTIHSFNLRIDSLFFRPLSGVYLCLSFFFFFFFFFDIFNEHPSRLTA